MTIYKIFGFSKHAQGKSSRHFMELFKYLQILKISGECVHFFMCMLLFFDIILHNKETSMLPTTTTFLTQ